MEASKRLLTHNPCTVEGRGDGLRGERGGGRGPPSLTASPPSLPLFGLVAFLVATFSSSCSFPCSYPRTPSYCSFLGLLLLLVGRLVGWLVAWFLVGWLPGWLVAQIRPRGLVTSQRRGGRKQILLGRTTKAEGTQACGRNGAGSGSPTEAHVRPHFGSSLLAQCDLARQRNCQSIRDHVLVHNVIPIMAVVRDHLFGTWSSIWRRRWKGGSDPRRCGLPIKPIVRSFICHDLCQDGLDVLMYIIALHLSFTI